MAIFFSPSESVIYAGALYNEYVAAGTWPSDAVEISDEVARQFHPSNQAPDKVLGTTKDGMPVWVDRFISDEEKISVNTGKKETLLSEATSKITIWQTKLLMGRKLTASEMASLNQWMDYIDAIQAIDAEVTEEIQWPKSP